MKRLFATIAVFALSITGLGVDLDDLPDTSIDYWTDGATKINTALNSINNGKIEWLGPKTTAERDAIETPAQSDVVYNTTASQFEIYDGAAWGAMAGDLLQADLDTLDELNALVSDATLIDVSSLTAHTGDVANPHSVTKTQVGLGSVDNTADADKPVSTATQTALDLKQDASTAATDSELTAHTGDAANPHTVTATQLGLGNVDNTTDLGKPVSTATQTALDLKQDASTAATDAELSAGLALKQDDLAVPSQAEAEAGTATTERVWTAQRIAQAIAALAEGGGGSANPMNDLALGTALTTANDYYDDFDANRTLTFSGTPSAGDTIGLQANVTISSVTLTIPTSYRLGTDGTTTSIALSQGNNELSWKYADGKWWLADTGAGTLTGSVADATVDAAAFSGNLTTTDDTVQEIADAVDALSVSGSGISIVSTTPESPEAEQTYLIQDIPEYRTYKDNGIDYYHVGLTEVDATPPEVTELAVDGDAVTITFDEAASQGAAFATSHWSLTGDTTGVATLGTFGGDGTSSWTATASVSFVATDLITYSFDGTPNSVEDSTGNDLAAIADADASNETAEAGTYYGNTDYPYSGSTKEDTAETIDIAVFWRVDLGSVVSGTITELEAVIADFDESSQEGKFAVYDEVAGEPGEVIASTNRFSDSASFTPTPHSKTVTEGGTLNHQYVYLAVFGEGSAQFQNKIYHEASADEDYRVIELNASEWLNDVHLGADYTLLANGATPLATPTNRKLQMRMKVE